MKLIILNTLFIMFAVEAYGVGSAKTRVYTNSNAGKASVAVNAHAGVQVSTGNGYTEVQAPFFHYQRGPQKTPYQSPYQVVYPPRQPTNYYPQSYAPMGYGYAEYNGYGVNEEAVKKAHAGYYPLGSTKSYPRGNGICQPSREEIVRALDATTQYHWRTTTTKAGMSQIMTVPGFPNLSKAIVRGYDSMGREVRCKFFFAEDNYCQVVTKENARSLVREKVRRTRSWLLRTAKKFSPKPRAWKYSTCKSSHRGEAGADYEVPLPPQDGYPPVQQDVAEIPYEPPPEGESSKEQEPYNPPPAYEPPPQNAAK